MKIIEAVGNYKYLLISVGNVYKFSMCRGRFFGQSWEYTGKVVDHKVHSEYSESFCVVNDEGIIYLWNLPEFRHDISRIHRAELVE